MTRKTKICHSNRKEFNNVYIRSSIVIEDASRMAVEQSFYLKLDPFQNIHIYDIKKPIVYNNSSRLMTDKRKTQNIMWQCEYIVLR